MNNQIEIQSQKNYGIICLFSNRMTWSSYYWNTLLILKRRALFLYHNINIIVQTINGDAIVYGLIVT